MTSNFELFPVAAPDDPLALAVQDTLGAGRDRLQLVPTEHSPLAQGQGAWPISVRSTCC
jgi:hypothetical protein